MAKTVAERLRDYKDRRRSEGGKIITAALSPQGAAALAALRKARTSATIADIVSEALIERRRRVKK